MTIDPGTRLGPYEVLSPIGAGGMGEVYRGRDTRLDRSVAIKVIPPEFAQRFEREAKSISALNHPHICTLFDVGPNYLVMELLEGESLADRLGKGPLPVEQVLRFGIQIADALDKAHRQGIVHRDLKPGNVMLTKSGAKLLDFGLAKDSGAAGFSPPEGATEQKPLTEEGTIVGTYQYMAPEQLEGLPADARTDIFALGAVLYEMATGRRAFAGKTRTSLIAAIVGANPAPMSEVQPLTPPALEHVVRKCLAKEPDDRWQSAHDIGAELRWISEAGSQAGVAVPVAMRRKSRERLAWAAGIVLALLAGGFAARALHLGQSAPPQYRFTIPMIDAGYKFGGNPRLSPDGQVIYFRASDLSGQVQVFRRRLDELKATPIEGTVDAFNFNLTADGRSLLLNLSAGVVKRVSTSGDPLGTVINGARGGTSNAAVSGDGTILVGSSESPIRRVLPDGNLEPITEVDTAHGEQGHDWPVFLPDGKRFLFLGIRRDAARGTVRFTLSAGKLGSKAITRIGDISSRVEYAFGRLFFVRDGTLMARPFDAARLQFTSADAAPVAEEVGFNSRSGAAQFDIAGSGTIVCHALPRAARLVWIDGAGKIISTVRGPEAFLPRLAVLPDRSAVVIPVADARGGSLSLWQFGLQRASATRVTFSPATESYPVVARDGTRIFFASDIQANDFDIYEAPLDGSTPPKLLVSGPGFQYPNDISPDGRFLLYTSNQNAVTTRQDLYILPLTGDQKPYPFLATPAIENLGTFSPDGKWIAYTSDATGKAQVYMKPFPGPGPARPVSTDGGTSARFSEDGKHLYFVYDGKLMVADVNPNGSTTEPRVALELADRIGATVPVGDRFLTIEANEAEQSPPLRVITGWQPPR